MSIHVLGVIVLGLVFLLGTLRPVNIGTFALIGSFVLGVAFVGESPKEVVAGFPGDVFVLLVGVTYLFGLAATNGTLEWIVEKVAGLIRGRRALVPWLLFLFSSLPTLAGALGPAGVAMLAPPCLKLAEKYRINRRLAALMVMHGSCAGNFSPLNGLAVVAQSAADTNGIHVSSVALFLGNYGYNLVLAVVIYLVFGGITLMRDGSLIRVQNREAAVLAGGGPQKIATASRSMSEDNIADAVNSSLRLDQILTMVAILGVVVLALGFDFDLGFIALTAAALLHCLFVQRFQGAEKKIVWSVVLLICGVMTLVAAMQRYGTIEWVGSGIGNIGTPLLTAFVLCLVGAITSAFGSSAGLIGILVPLAVPFIAQGSISATWVIVALSVSATVVDAMPFSSVGALTLSNTPEVERPKMLKFMLVWGSCMVVTAPIFTWLAFILPGW
ncbi:SLC13 family permease [Glutamicibacter mysorens]|uniref:SLC13 family permease n=1 Tax=Glutamicibacter mysorens TaxID=257984 RepID=UPI0020C62DFF|nr:SLC13 family permease [Glutamicibacter mysorens]UTM45831.1 SLC13 family permease [Glutamicibacter mysorens]